MAKYPVVRIDNMSGTKNPENLVSLRYFVGDTETAIPNGSIVKLEGLLPGEREVYKAVTPEADTPIEDLVLVASPELNYDERKTGYDDFINEPGGVASRGYRLVKNSVFSVTADGLTATNPAVGNIVEAQADTKPKVVTSLTSGSTKIGKIEAIEPAGRFTYYVIRIG